MTHVCFLRCDLFRCAATWGDSPDVQFVWEGTLDEVDERHIGRPQGKVTVEPGSRSEDGFTLRSTIAVGNEERISGSGSVIRESRGVGRPVELRHAFKVSLRLPAERWHPPDADVAATRAAALLANPKRYQRTIRREPQGADRWIDEFRRAPAGQVVELPRSGLRNPDVCLSVTVRQKRHKLTVARYCSRLLHSFEVRECQKSRVSDWASPEILRPLKPQACANCHRDSRRSQHQDKPPWGRRDRNRWVGQLCRGIGRRGIVQALRRCSEIATARPSVQLCPGSEDRAHSVMKVPMNGHPLPLLPALDSRHVAIEEGSDFL